MVVGMRSFFGPDGVDRIPQREGEMLIREALEGGIHISEIPAKVAFTMRSLIFVGLALDLGYGESDLDAVLVRAEEIAVGRGFSPTLAFE
jgi:hypothetical protein